MQPIGVMRCDYQSRYETPRQPAFAGENEGVIELVPGFNLEQALVGLEGFSHIWVLFQFHKNPNAERPPVMIQPPRYTSGKVGVLATRSPHRPNPIGMSCLRLERIEGRRLFVRGFDLLDETPVLDIKPYIPMLDSHPEATTGWLQPAALYDVRLSPEVQAQSSEISEVYDVRLDRYANVQLKEFPLDIRRKRIEQVSENEGILAFREWRIHYQVDEQQKTVTVHRLEKVESASGS